jgi:transcriptional regulator with XRE-family HTH domain
MGETESADLTLDRLIAQRLKALRAERGWSLDELAALSHVSRATLSRLEKAEGSPTATVLGKLAAAYGLTISRLLQMVEEQFEPVIRSDVQMLWRDPSIGFKRRSVSPPAQRLAGEVLECELSAGARIAYDQSPRPGLEHHLVVVEGRLSVTIDQHTHDLRRGDCLRYQLSGSSAFATPKDSGAKYFLFLV